MSFNESTSTNEQEPTKLFSDNFFSVYSTGKINPDVKKLELLTFDLPNNGHFSVDDVFLSLLKLKGVWSTSLNNFSGILF